MFHKAKAIMKENECMKSYDKATLLYIETDVSGVGLGVALLQKISNTSCNRDEALDNSIIRATAFASMSLTGAEKRYSNIEREALGILYSLEKFHHYFSVREVSIITDHKPLTAIFKKDVTTLSQRLQQILLRIHQYRVKIIYMPGPDLFMPDWLSRQNQNKNKDKEITCMQISISALQ